MNDSDLFILDPIQFDSIRTACLCFVLKTSEVIPMAVVGSDPRLVGAFAEEETAAEDRVSGNLRQNYVGFEHLQPIRWDPCYI